MSGHEVMAYTFVSGTQCQPKRRKFAQAALMAPAAVSPTTTMSGLIIGGGGGSECDPGAAEIIRVAVPSLSRSPSPVRKDHLATTMLYFTWSLLYVYFTIL